MSASLPFQLVLGSSSPYRRELLSRLRLPFSTESPNVDEMPLPGEAPASLAARLAMVKARAVADRHASRDVVVIGSDQVAELAGAALGKPGSHTQAVTQLRAMRGQRVMFHTGVAVIRPLHRFEASALVTVRVEMAQYRDEDIETYLRCERPYDCAGSAKVEGLGITMLRKVESDDPTALIGLPMIETVRLLREAGVDVLGLLGSMGPQASGAGA